MAPNEKDMLFLDPRREQFWERVRTQIEQWKDLSTYDMCCGYGQFTLHRGVDFSKEMIDLANQKSQREFLCADVREVDLPPVDVIYEVNSLHSLGWTPEQFYERFKGKAQVIACLEADRFTIFHDYDKRKTD